MTDVLSPIEAIMWRVGQTGSLRMTVGAVLIVDRLPDRDALIERLRYAGAHAERLTQRPGGSTSLRSRPSWINGPIAPEHQVRSLSVSTPGTMREVLDLVSLLESVPFDPERSPWDITLIDGLEDGKGAIYVRAHHVLTDGVGGIRLLGLLFDEPSWPHSPLTSTPRPEPTPPEPVSYRRPGTITFSATIDGPDIIGRALARVNAARDIDAARVCCAQCAMGDRRRELGVPAAHGDRRPVVVAPDDAVHAQPVRGPVRRWGPRHCAGVGRQQK